MPGVWLQQPWTLPCLLLLTHQIWEACQQSIAVAWGEGVSWDRGPGADSTRQQPHPSSQSYQPHTRRALHAPLGEGAWKCTSTEPLSEPCCPSGNIQTRTEAWGLTFISPKHLGLSTQGQTFIQVDVFDLGCCSVCPSTSLRSHQEIESCPLQRGSENLKEFKHKEGCSQQSHQGGTHPPGH